MKRTLKSVVCLALFLLVGCHKEAESTNETKPSSPSHASTDAPSKPITFSTSDGWKIVGDLYGSSKNPQGIVILLHQRGGSAKDWLNLCSSLQEAGFSALALDLRGTGRSMPVEAGKEAPWLVSKDIDAVIATLRGPVALAGASYGANNALIYAADHPKAIKAVALFSPGVDYHGLEALPAAEKYRGVVGVWNQEGDVISGEGPKRIVQAGRGAGYTLRSLQGVEHGTALLTNDVIHETVSFFKSHLK